MPAFIDYTNHKIGRVKVLSLLEKKSIGVRWNCKCDCGNEFSCWGKNFYRGEKFECKLCIFERKRGPDLTGRVFGRWTVLRRTLDIHNNTVWHCKCDCGNEGYVSSSALHSKNKSRSCGCWGRKMKSKWANPSLYPKASGISTTKFYHLRTQLIHKCHNPEWVTYSSFGAKGITVCELWRNSALDMYEWAISQGWKEKTSIVLKEGAKEFSPDNVYLIHYYDLRADIARSHGQKITYKGQSLLISQWAEYLNMNITSLRKRLHVYPSIEEAFEVPFKKMVFFNNPELKKEACDMFKKLRSCTKVAKHFGVTPQTIGYHLREAGLDTTWNRLEIDDQEIVKLVNEGSSLSAIAKKFNTSFTCIKRRLERMKGIPKKR